MTPAPSYGLPFPVSIEATLDELPLLFRTARSWAELAARELPTFLADHAVCEQQVAMYALSLAGYYPDDAELVKVAAALAVEEIQHFRRVFAILERRGLPLAGRRKNPWIQALRARIEVGREPWTKVDRLLFGALVEARSCERFTCLLGVVEDAEVRALLADLGPAEKRHWLTFRALAERNLPAAAVESRWRGWLEFERELAQNLGIHPTVHG